MTDDIHTTDAPTESHDTTQAATPAWRLRRSRSNRMIAGVCAGVAELFGIDAAVIRVLAVLATLLGFGTGVLVYLACWVIVPEAD